MSTYIKNYSMKQNKNIEDHNLKKNDHIIYKDANFSINSRYQIQSILGKGSYGTVCSAIDTRSSNGEETLQLAIKKVSSIFKREVLMKRAVRELKLMRHFKGHRNVIIYLFYDTDRSDINIEIDCELN